MVMVKEIKTFCQSLDVLLTRVRSTLSLYDYNVINRTATKALEHYVVLLQRTV